MRSAEFESRHFVSAQCNRCRHPTKYIAMGLKFTRDNAFKWAMGLAVVVVALIALWRLGPALLPPDHMEVGIVVGETAPVEMFVRDASGAQLRISEASGENGLVLVLQRSLDWCPFCLAEVKDREAIAQPLAERGYALASLTYDPPEILAEFAEDNAISFTLMSDRTIGFVDALGLRDPNYPEGHYAFGVPRPAVLVLSPDGEVRAKFVTADYRQRLENEQVLDLVDEAGR